MTFQQLQQVVYRRLGYTDAPPAEVVARIKDFLNERHRQILTLPGMRRLREVTGYAFQSVAQNATVTLSPAQKVERPLRVWDVTNASFLVPRTLDWYRAIAPDPSLSYGTPSVWVLSPNEQATGLDTMSLILWPTPSDVLNYQLDYERVIPTLSLVADTPLLPVGYHDLLALGARMDEYEYRDQVERHMVARAQYEQRLKDLRVYLNRNVVTQDPGHERTEIPSRLGPWFPAGT
jgi:hypothetical protein